MITWVLLTRYEPLTVQVPQDGVSIKKRDEMKREHKKSTFNGTLIKAVNLQPRQCKKKQLLPTNATIGNTYTILIHRTRPPTADTHNPQMKSKKKKRESRLPFSRWPTAGRWRLSCSAGTCSPSARVPRAHSYTELRRALLREPHSTSIRTRTFCISNSQTLNVRNS